MKAFKLAGGSEGNTALCEFCRHRNADTCPCPRTCTLNTHELIVVCSGYGPKLNENVTETEI